MSILSRLVSSFTSKKSRMSALQSDKEKGDTTTISNGGLCTVTTNANTAAIALNSALSTLEETDKKSIVQADNTISTNQSTNHESKTMTTPQELYAAMTESQKIVELEKAVAQQGEYLKSFKEAMKLINRRNTLAVIELQKLVRDAELKHPDLQPMITPVMTKVSEILDFKKPYEV